MSSGTLAIQTYNSIAQLEGIRSQWEDLLAAYPLATTFSTPEWLLPWWRNFGQSQELLVVAAFADSSLAALAALSFTSVRIAGSIPLRVLRLMGDGSHDSDNLDIPVRPGFEDSFAHLLVEVIEKHRSRWDVGYLNSVSPHSPSIAAIRRVLEQRKSVMFEGRTPASAIALPETWEQYLKQLSSKERGKIGLRARRLEKKYAVRIRRCEDEQELDPLLQVLYDLHGKHWQARGLPGTLHVPARRRFYSELAGLLLRRRRLDFWILEADGKVVAAQFGLRHGATVFSLQEGFDTEYASDSVGYVLRSQVIKELLGQGIRRYDFLGGADESKKRWGAEVGHYLNVSFARPWSKGAAYLKTLHHARQGKSWLREHVSASTWELLHNVNVRLKGAARKPLQGGQPSPGDRTDDPQ